MHELFKKLNQRLRHLDHGSIDQGINIASEQMSVCTCASGRTGVPPCRYGPLDQIELQLDLGDLRLIYARNFTENSMRQRSRANTPTRRHN